MKIQINEKSGIIFDDCIINGFFWTKSGEDIIFDVEWSGQSDFNIEIENIQTTFLKFETVADVDIKMDFEKYMGAPSIYEFNIVEENGFYKIEFVFLTGPKGYFKFICKKCYFMVNELALMNMADSPAGSPDAV